MADNGEAPLTAVALADGRTGVLGQTYGAQIVMRAYGGEFNGSLKLWTFGKPEDADKAVKEAVRLIGLSKARA
jgi:hypothetical protein